MKGDVMDFKWFAKSKTVWVNGAALVVAVLALPEFISVVPADWLPAIGAVTALANMALRIAGGDRSITLLDARVEFPIGLFKAIPRGNRLDLTAGATRFAGSASNRSTSIIRKSRRRRGKSCIT